MNAVFTIVEKNYLAHANTLGDSLRASNPDLAFHVILADEAEGVLDTSAQRYPTLEARSIGRLSMPRAIRRSSATRMACPEGSTRATS